MVRVIFAILYVLTCSAMAEPIDAKRIRVIDGDTIRVDGSKPDVRLVGFNTPETRRAKSDTERELGGKATGRLREILLSSKVELTYVACACRPRTEGTDHCNFGRKCGRLTANGKDVGDILIGEGLAAKFICGPTNCPKMETPWR